MIAAGSLRARAALRVLSGFGGATRAVCAYVAPRTVAEIAETFARARAEGLAVALRGAGRSYGDAALADGGLVVDTSRMDRLLAWDPVRGVIEVEPGLTIEGLWRRTLLDGYWPPVVPGTMTPTLGGCLAMNVHGKNNFAAGPIGDHVLDVDLLTPRGEVLRCSRQENADVFHAAIGGLGLLGAFTRIRLKMKPVESGHLRVEPLVAWSLDALFEVFEERIASSDYVVGWVDALAGGRALGRGIVHAARYVGAGEDPDGPRSFFAEEQALPARFSGIPRDVLWRLMRPFATNAGMTLVNAAKMLAARVSSKRPYLQSHVAFAFLLDYIPDWRRAFGPEGFIQHQVFVPKESARATLRGLLELARARGLPPYLCVLKRHRPDPFLLSHAVDGWSLAMDFRVTSRTRASLWALAAEMTSRVIEAGGRFHFAKDSVLGPGDVRAAFGRDRIDAFLAIKARLDPEGLLATDLGRRVQVLGTAA